MNSQDTDAILSKIEGQFIQRVRRIMYVTKGEITNAGGPVEISFTDGSPLLLDAGPDGEALYAAQSAWVDYFAEPLSAENREFVASSGKWTAFDVSQKPPYSRLIGERVAGVSPVRVSSGKVTGVTIMTDSCTVRVEVEADEVSVDIA